MSLHLVHPDERAAPAARSTRVPYGRPGEHREPLHLTYEAAAELGHTARGAAVPASLALAVLLEMELAVSTVTESGWTTSAIGGYSDRSVLLSQAQADYLEFLTGRRAVNPSGRRPATPAGELIAVPVRFLSFCDDRTIRVAVRRDLDAALLWEAHAVRSGRTLTEWALRQALVAATAARGG